MRIACQSHVRAPTYQYVPHDGGYAHLKEYTCVCRVEHFNLEVKERRKNQKEARKAAATQEGFEFYYVSFDSATFIFRDLTFFVRFDVRF